ncbi:hypothetical protein [Pseudomonas sp. Marseille-QA0892]
MQDLKRYTVNYCLNGEPNSMTLEGYDAPSLDQVRLQLLIKHTEEPRVVEDAPWEANVRPSLESRSIEVGLSDIEIHQAT